MSVKITSSDQRPVATTRGLKAAKALATFGYCLSGVGLAACIITIIGITMDSSINAYGAYAPLILAQDMISCIVIAIVSYECYHIVDSCQNEGRFFFARQGRRIRIIATAFLLLFLLQVTATIVYCMTVSGASFTLVPSGDPFGFPTSQMWMLVDSSYADSDFTSIGADTALNRDINIMPLVFAVIAWCLSYVFDYGYKIQEEQDQTL